MAVNKVEFGGRTLIDTSMVTVTPDKLSKGFTALNAAGELITGENEGGGSLESSDDDNGNVMITMSGYLVSDDGNGNIVLNN